jgi:hypothetical protein
MGPFLSASLLIVCLFCAGLAAAGNDEPRVNPQAAALKEFSDRAREYMERHNRLAAELPPVSAHATPEEIEAHREGLAKAIRRARTTAGERQGHIFTRHVDPLLRGIVRRDLRSRDLADSLAVLEEVPLTPRLRFNDPWPSNAARGTVPPRLLKSLPALPAGLEYRFLGRHLVLVDSAANLIVDYLTNVIPSSIRRR